MITKNVKLQILNFCIPEVVHGVLNDTDRYVSIEITDLPSGTNISSSTLYIKTPSGVIYQQAEAGLAAGGICFDISKALKELGPNECTIKMETMDGTVASTFIFIVECHPAAGEGPQPTPTGGSTFQIEFDFPDETHRICKYAFEEGMTFADLIDSEYNVMIDPDNDRLAFDHDSDIGDVVIYRSPNGNELDLFDGANYLRMSDVIDGTKTYNCSI